MGGTTNSMAFQPITDADSGATLTNPEDCGGPDEYINKIFEDNAENGKIDLTKFKGLAKCAYKGMVCAEGAPGREALNEAIEEMVSALGDDEACAKQFPEAMDELANKLGDIVVPVAAQEIFKWLDRNNGDKGIDKAEVEDAIGLLQTNPAEAAATFAWSVIDKDKNGGLSSAEIAGFLAQMFLIKKKVLHAIVDTLSASLKHPVVDAIVNAIFAMMGTDTHIDTASLEEPAVEAFEAMNEE